HLLLALDDEEPLAVHGKVGGPAGRLDRAGGPVLLDRGDRGAEAALVRVRPAEVARRRGAGGVGDVELRLGERPAGLKGDGVDVGDVVADDVEPRLVDVEPGKAGEE